jgi:hypothetical protein
MPDSHGDRRAWPRIVSHERNRVIHDAWETRPGSFTVTLRPDWAHVEDELREELGHDINTDPGRYLAVGGARCRAPATGNPPRSGDRGPAR